MLFTLFLLPDGFLSQMMDYVSAIFTDAKLLILLALGVPLAFYVIKNVIGLMPSR
jgi:hypothetical protein